MTRIKYLHTIRGATALVALVLATGCDTNHPPTQDTTLSKTTEQDTSAMTLNSDLGESTPATAGADAQATVQVDWSQIDSGLEPASLEGYEYPIAIDSDPVKAFAEHQNISLAQAQHNLVLGTASNEPLLALFDELGDTYVSHALSEGEDMALVVTTTTQVAPSRFDYVIANDFGKGLVLPIIITPVTTLDNTDDR